MGAATHAAELHRAAGVPRAATRWTQQAADWAAQCQAVKAPELVLAVAPTPLTRREREVAQLAAPPRRSPSGAASRTARSRTTSPAAANGLGVRRSELAALLGQARARHLRARRVRWRTLEI